MKLTPRLIALRTGYFGRDEIDSSPAIVSQGHPETGGCQEADHDDKELTHLNKAASHLSVKISSTSTSTVHDEDSLPAYYSKVLFDRSIHAHSALYSFTSHPRNQLIAEGQSSPSGLVSHRKTSS